MRRPEQLAELIREELIQVVGYELDDPRVESVTVTDVRVTDNLRDARVFVLTEGTDEEKAAAIKALTKAAPYIRRQLGLALNLKFTPDLHFVRDTVEERAARVDALLAEIKIDSPASDVPAETEEEGETSDK